jgi:hypothetical protein
MMPIRTPAAVRAVALHIQFACWPIGIQAESIFAAEELAEVEFVHGLPRLFDILVGCY